MGSIRTQVFNLKVLRYHVDKKDIYFTN